METIKNESPKIEKSFGQKFESFENNKKRVTKNLLNYTSMFVGIFIIFVIITAYTTDIKSADWKAIVNLGLSFFILVFCVYSMYINYASSGTKAGKESKVYIDATEGYDRIKDYIISNKLQVGVPRFVKHFIAEELKNAREQCINEPGGITFKTYLKKYLGKDSKDILLLTDLSDTQKAAIIKANSLKPIELSADMLLKRGRGMNNRKPLGCNPQTAKVVNLITRFVRILFSSLLIVSISFDIITNPSWATVAECLLKIMIAVLNGVAGYKMGFENITITTVNYINDQTDLLKQAVNYIEANPCIEEDEEETVEETQNAEESYHCNDTAENNNDIIQESTEQPVDTQTNNINN